MKNFIALICFSFAMLLFVPHQEVKASPEKQSTCFIQKVDIEPAVAPQEEGGVVANGSTETSTVTETNFFAENWGALLLGLLAFIEIIVRITPSEKDNSIFNWIVALINAILPNLKKGGGTFKVSSK